MHIYLFIYTLCMYDVYINPYTSTVYICVLCMYTYVSMGHMSNKVI